jgi:hypothetical protein
MNETGRQYIKISNNLIVLRFEVTLYNPDTLEENVVKRLQVSDTQLKDCDESDFIALLSYFNQNPGFTYEIHTKDDEKKVSFVDWIKENKIGFYQKYQLLIPEQ